MSIRKVIKKRAYFPKVVFPSPFEVNCRIPAVISSVAILMNHRCGSVQTGSVWLSPVESRRAEMGFSLPEKIGPEREMEISYRNFLLLAEKASALKAKSEGDRHFGPSQEKLHVARPPLRDFPEKQ